MKCPGCQASLAHINAAGEPIIRMRGLVLKAAGVVAMCPACRGDVPVVGEAARILSARLTCLPTSVARGSTAVAG